MLISLKSHPNSLISSTAFKYVLSVVPKPGIVTACIPFLSSPNASKAFTVTRSANVESRPPEIPITTFEHPVCSRRLLSPQV